MLRQVKVKTSKQQPARDGAHAWLIIDMLRSVHPCAQFNNPWLRDCTARVLLQ